MAEQHLCQRHGRPAVASRVRLRPDGTQEVEYLCEIDLAEERMSGRLGGSRSLFDEFFSDFFDRSPGGAAPTQTPARRAESVDVTQFFSDATRELLATEEHFSTIVRLEGGREVRLTGSADRLELTADGRVVVVDLKTARNRPSGAAVTRDLQLALYQYAVDSGGVDDLVPGPARSGGADLLQLGIADDAVAAVVQPQPAPVDDAARDPLRGQLATAAAVLRAESFPAIPGDHCKTCDFVALCPVRSAGAVLDA